MCSVQLHAAASARAATPTGGTQPPTNTMYQYPLTDGGTGPRVALGRWYKDEPVAVADCTLWWWGVRRQEVTVCVCVCESEHLYLSATYHL
ncbi:hypothetical protein E2C01_100236 [Portunus trituberculatus]|uniref:Uncharacterized protein n=1 Tax=Portunus trituberculatus TaxID=210409 RepID=A0A5B7K2H7_PORTR|nr:hypothetical protein [Portunus trituberculatus]